MKVAITSLGESVDSPVDQRFGRARFFMVHDTETGEWSAHSNQKNVEAMQGAGINAAQAIINLGISVLITGHCGPKAYRALSAGKVEIYQGAQDTVGITFKSYQAGKMATATGPDVDEHFGGR